MSPTSVRLAARSVPTLAFGRSAADESAEQFLGCASIAHRERRLRSPLRNVCRWRRRPAGHQSYVDRAEKLRAADQAVALAGLRVPSNDNTASNAPASGGSGGGLN